MKKTIIIFIVLCITFSVEALTYKPIYPARSICYKFLVKDQNGVAISPITGDAVYMFLMSTPNSTAPLLTLTGEYDATGLTENPKFNYEFSAETTDTDDLPVGEAYWYMEVINTINKTDVIIDVSRVTIKK